MSSICPRRRRPTWRLPLQVLFPAIDPSTASNVSNYSLTLINPNGTTTDESQFITSATFVAGPPILDSTNTFIVAYAGVINLTIATGLPAGNYTFTAHTAGGNIPGLTDAAGNPLCFVSSTSTSPSSRSRSSSPTWRWKARTATTVRRPSAARARTTSCPRPTPTTSPAPRRPPRRSSSTCPTPFPLPTAAALRSITHRPCSSSVLATMAVRPTATSAPWARAAWAARATGSPSSRAPRSPFITSTPPPGSGCRSPRREAAARGWS